MTAYQDAHNAGCELCRCQLAAPQPFHDDLCHFNIAPGGGSWDEDAPVIQCPHLAAAGSPSRLCEHHTEEAKAAYARLTERTAPFN